MINQTTHTINKLPKSVVEIIGELDSDVFESYFQKALKNIGDKVEIDGFRPGKAPESVLLSKIPEIKILEEMAEIALAEHYPKIIEESALDVISRPEIAITKLGRNNPLGYKIITTIMPEVELPEYKNMAKEVNSEKEEEITVTDEEVEITIQDIRKSRAKKQHITEIKPEETDKKEEVKEEDLPVFNDEFVQAMGPFENVEDFKEKLKENIKLEKTNQSREKKRLKIVEKIIIDSKIDVPEILINAEVEKILYRMESDITAMGMKFEDYLKHLQKNRGDLEKEFQADGEKKAKLGLILNKISRLENIVADKKEIEKEVSHIIEHYKDADIERARIYAENIITNEKIFQFLEDQK